MHDVRQVVILAYASKALAAEAEYRRMVVPRRQDGATLWANAALYAWCQAEHGHIAATDVVGGHVDPNILDRRFLASVYDDDAIVEGAWNERHELLLVGALDAMTQTEAQYGLLHHVAGLSADEVADYLGRYRLGTDDVLAAVRRKWNTLRDGNTSDVIAHTFHVPNKIRKAHKAASLELVEQHEEASATTEAAAARERKSTRSKSVHHNHSAAQDTMLAVVIAHGPVSKNDVAEKTGFTSQAVRTSLLRMACRGLVVCTGSRARTDHGGGRPENVWEVTDEGRRLTCDSTTTPAPEPVVTDSKEEATVSEVTGTQRDRVVAAMTGQFTARDVAKLLDVARNRANTLLNTMHGRGDVEKIIHGPHNVMWELTNGGAEKSRPIAPSPSQPKAKPRRKSRSTKKVRPSLFARVRGFAVRALDGGLRCVGLERIAR